MDVQTPFRRDPERRIVAGICGAIAARAGIEPTWLRLAVALIAVFSGGLVVWAYAILWAITPLGTNGRAPLSRWIDRARRIFGSPPVEYHPPDRV